MTTDLVPHLFQVLLVATFVAGPILAVLPSPSHRRGCECCLNHSFEIETPIV